MNCNSNNHPSFANSNRLAVYFSAICILLLLLAATPAFAVGLGNISSSSFLGQPLKAVIKINTGTDSIGIDELKVSQLTNRQASDIGIELAGYYQNFQPKLLDSNGTLIIELTSRKPVNEPFLNIVIELSWLTGKVYREYTLLLDPVVISAELESKPGTATTVTRRTSPGAGQASISAAIGNESYRVQIGDSLSKIASRLVEGSNIRRRPMMQWLVQKNPRAFVKGDMDRLKAGALLMLPDDENLIFDALQSPKAKVVEAIPIEAIPATQVLVKTKVVEKISAPDKPVERLSIVTPGTSKTGAKGAASSESDLINQLQNQLAATNEMVERLRRDNQAMRDRLLAIEKSSYVDSLERLVLLKEDEINNLQAQLDGRPSEPLGNSQPIQKQEASPSSDSTDAEGGKQQYGLIALLLVSLIGALYFFYRWRFVDRVPNKPAFNNAADEESLLRELDQIIASRTKIDVDQNLQDDKAKGAEVISETQNEFSTIGKSGVDSSKRRADEVVKKRIQEKTSSYKPPEIDELERTNNDELYQRISEAIEAANRGAFDIAEALLRGEQAEQARIGSSADEDSQLDVALQYVEKLRKGAGK